MDKKLQMGASFLKSSIEKIIEIENECLKMEKDSKVKFKIKKDLDDLEQALKILEKSGSINEKAVKSSIDDAINIINKIAERNIKK